MNYVPLYVKTDYSILSSLIKIDENNKRLARYDNNRVRDIARPIYEDMGENPFLLWRGICYNRLVPFIFH